MNTEVQKSQIVEHLNNLDNLQAQQVLNYIKSLVNQPPSKQTLKRQAMREIRQALVKDRVLHVNF